MNKSGNILWAVDAFTEDKELHKKSARLIANWIKTTHEKVEPVFIMSPDQLRMPAEVFANLKADAEKSAQQKLKSLLKSAKVPGLLPPTYLASMNYSLQKAVHTLLDYAKDTGASLIVVSTQSKKGATRFLFGSFAEALTTQSSIPVLLVSPKMEVSRGLKHLLFATDLSDKSKENFNEVMELAKNHKMDLTLFNKMEYYTQFTNVSITSMPPYENYLKEDLQARQKTLEGMAENARKKGIKVDVVIDQNPKVFPASAAVLKAAKKCNADLIVVSSQTGPVATALLGSTTRQVMRTSACPLWIIHPKGATQS